MHVKEFDITLRRKLEIDIALAITVSMSLSVSVSVYCVLCRRRIDRHSFQEGRRVRTAADEHQWLQLSAVCASYNIGEGGGCHCVLEEQDSTSNQPSPLCSHSRGLEGCLLSL